MKDEQLISIVREAAYDVVTCSCGDCNGPDRKARYSAVTWSHDLKARDPLIARDRSRQHWGNGFLLFDGAWWHHECLARTGMPAAKERIAATRLAYVPRIIEATGARR